MPVNASPLVAWGAIAPILVMAGGAVLSLLLISARRSVRRSTLVALSLATIGGTAYLVFDSVGRRVVGMQGMVAVDGVALFTDATLLLSAALVTVASYDYLQARGIHRVEYYPLLLFATAGMMLLASANDLIMVFIALEVLSLALYILVGIAREDAGSREASLKYFLLGSFSSAILLYGVALTYGATGQTNIARIAERATAGDVDPRLIFAAAALIAVGFAFKIAAVPFHMWTPDVYQGAPTSVTAFMAAATKASAFAALLRVFMVAFDGLEWDWRPVMWLIAIVTMAVGSVLAIAQSDVKRMLAYSSVAHAGFILVGLVAANAEGLAGTLFYLLVYAAMTIGAFLVVAVSAPEGRERLDISAWTGLGHSHPVLAGAMTLFLLSLAGLPPTAGFMTKFFIFQAAIDAGETWIAIAGVLASVVASFFYLRLIVVMWLQEAAPDDAGVGLQPMSAAAIGIAAAAVVVIGVWPQALMDLARTAAIFTG